MKHQIIFLMLGEKENIPSKSFVRLSYALGIDEAKDLIDSLSELVLIMRNGKREIEARVFKTYILKVLSSSLRPSEVRYFINFVEGLNFDGDIKILLASCCDKLVKYCNKVGISLSYLPSTEDRIKRSGNTGLKGGLL